MQKLHEKEVSILVLVIMASVCVYMTYALQYITRESGVNLLLGVMSVLMMITVLIGLWIEMVRIKITNRISVADSRCVSDIIDCNIWLYIVEKLMSLVSVVLGSVMTGLAAKVWFLLGKEQIYVSLGMLFSSIPVIVATVRLWKRTEKKKSLWGRFLLG